MGATPLPLLATVDDLRLWPGVSVPDSRTASAEAVLRRASALVRSYTRNSWVTDGGDLVDVPDDVSGVVVQVAARVWVNPTGATRRVTGPSSLEWNDDRGDGLFLTATERATLAPYRTPAAAGGGLRTVSTYRGDLDAFGTVWVPTAPAPGPLFPFLDESDC